MHLSARIKPLAAIIAGIMLFAAGIVWGRIPYRVPGPFYWSAYKTSNMCRNVGQIVGRQIETPMCVHAHEILTACGTLIILGAVSVLTGIAAGIVRQQPSSPSTRPNSRVPEETIESPLEGMFH